MPSIAADQRARRAVFERSEFVRRVEPREAQGGAMRLIASARVPAEDTLNHTVGARHSGRLRLGRCASWFSLGASM
jgi:hypothetical protein